MEKDKVLKNEIEELNAPRLQIDGIEEFEDRLEMGIRLGNMCGWSMFGG